MYQTHRYRANLVDAFQSSYTVCLTLVGLATVLTTSTLIGSFRYHQQRTAMTYVFHPQGAALQLYDQGQVRPAKPTRP
jgi:hypothetical protein